MDQEVTHGLINHKPGTLFVWSFGVLWFGLHDMIDNKQWLGFILRLIFIESNSHIKQNTLLVICVPLH